MKITSTGTSAETWLQRARTVGSKPAETDRPSPRAQDAAEKLSAWDPYEVWLHRIRRPQQGRDGTAK